MVPPLAVFPGGIASVRPALNRGRDQRYCLTLNTRVHQVTDRCRHLHCYSCDMDEPTKGYRLCYECHHMYVTAEDLIDAHNAGPSSIGVDNAEQIYACPLCAHDF